MTQESKHNPESEWFGYEHVSADEKTERVKDVFSSVADNYDIMNDLMSGGMHRLWKDKLVHMMHPKPNEKVLDVAGGTGDIARRCLKATEGKAIVTVCDLNEEMMRVGKTRTIDEGWITGINWVAGNAETLPFEDSSMDLVCISFGLRNVTRIDQAISEFFRVLKPTGRFFCMEFSPGVIPPLKKLYDIYSFSVLPWLGDKVAKDQASYQYLAESIRQFPVQDELATRMKTVGFEQVSYKNLMGGIVAIHQGWKL